MIANFTRVSNHTVATATTAEESLRLAFSGGNRVPANFLPTWVRTVTPTTVETPKQGRKTRANRALKAKPVELVACRCSHLMNGAGETTECTAKVAPTAANEGFAPGHVEITGEFLGEAFAAGDEIFDALTDKIMTAGEACEMLGYDVPELATV